jgi:hypothetical protein
MNPLSCRERHEIKVAGRVSCRVEGDRSTGARFRIVGRSVVLLNVGTGFKFHCPIVGFARAGDDGIEAGLIKRTTVVSSGIATWPSFFQTVLCEDSQFQH